MADTGSTDWNGAAVRKWLQRRVVATRADQVAAERAGRDGQDDCDKAAAEEMVCGQYRDAPCTDDPAAFTNALRLLLARDDYVWRGVYDDTRFDRHVRSFIHKLMRMVNTNTGFGNTTRYQ